MKTRAASFLLALVLTSLASASFVPRPAYAPPLDPKELVDDEFEGKYRLEVKTSAFRDANGDVVIDWKPKSLGTMLDRLNKWDMNDSWMKAHHKWHHTVAPTERVEEEEKNVRVRGWLKAIKYELADGSAEGDNDFHIILSNYQATDPKERFLNVEISGLPKANGVERDMIRQTREQIVGILGDVNLQKGKYYKPKSAIRVEIEGSLYFDGSHSPGQVGPAGMRPTTVWEIHPVTSIVKP